jgi:hypothetical protein
MSREVAVRLSASQPWVATAKFPPLARSVPRSPVTRSYQLDPVGTVHVSSVSEPDGARVSSGAPEGSEGVDWHQPVRTLKATGADAANVIHPMFSPQM